MSMYKKRRLRKIAKRCGLEFERFYAYCKEVKKARKLFGIASGAPR